MSFKDYHQFYNVKKIKVLHFVRTPLNTHIFCKKYQFWQEVCNFEKKSNLSEARHS